MGIAVLQPDGIGNHDQWTLGGGVTKWQNVKLPDDDNTTRIVESNVNNRQSFTIDDLPTASAVNSVEVKMRADKTGAADNVVNMFTRLGGTNLDYGNHTVSTSWTDYTNSGVGRPGGGSWAPADFPPVGALELGVRLQSSAGDSARVTTLYMNVSFEPPSGGFIWLLAQWLPPLLSVASHGLMKREITEILQNLRVQPSSPEEFARIFEAFQRRPAWL